MKRLMLLAAVAMLGWSGAAAQAGVFDDVAVQYWAGTGAKESVVVVDFNTGHNYAFGYRWDGDANTWMALEAITAAGDLDKSAYLHPLYGWFVTDFAYPDATKRGPDMSFFASADGNAWSPFFLGVSTRQLTDGGWDGFCFGTWGGPPDYAFSPADGPVTPFLTAAPEPGSLAILALAGAALAARRRRRPVV